MGRRSRTRAYKRGLEASRVRNMRCSTDGLARHGTTLLKITILRCCWHPIPRSTAGPIACPYPHGPTPRISPPNMQPPRGGGCLLRQHCRLPAFYMTR